MRNLNDLSILENIENYPFHKRFKIFKGHSIFDFISPKFPKITDIKIKKLEEDLNEYSSFNFSRSLVGYISLEKNAKESPSFFVSEEYDDFSRSFVGSSFYRMKPYFMNVGEIEKKKIDREFPGKIFPFMYFLQSDNELGKIIIRNFSQKNREDGNYLRGVYVSMGICPRKSGNFTLRALESRIDNAYNTKKAYEKVDLNN